MTKQFTSNEKWRQLRDEYIITDYIKNFSKNVFKNQYKPGRLKYGAILLGDPLNNIAEEVGDTISYIAMAKAQQTEILKQCNESRSLLEGIQLELEWYVEPDTEMIVKMIKNHLNEHIDLRTTYPTN